MKKLYFLLLLLTGVAKAQIVSVPDANFKAKLLAALPSNLIAKNLSGNYFKIDANSDNQIQVSEAQQVSYLKVNSAVIADLTGIAAFVNLKNLDCSLNQITELDVTALTQLLTLNCKFNSITELNMDGLTTLTSLDCSSNGITSLALDELTNLTFLGCASNELATLDVSSLVNLQTLGCSGNQLQVLDLTGLNNLISMGCTGNLLTSLDLSGHTSLVGVGCKGNLLTSLNLSGLSNVTDLDCSDNFLTSLDVSDLVNLQIFRCSNNQLTALELNTLTNMMELSCFTNQIQTLDLSNDPSLVWLFCQDNQLTFISLKNGVIEEATPNFQNNPDLVFICADEGQIASLQQLLNGLGMDATVCSTYCTFTPGGDYNTITGTATFDANNNGCDANDDLHPNIRIDISDVNLLGGASFTSGIGSYLFYTQAGSFEVTPDVENPSWFTFSPPSVTIPFADNNNNIATQNFCITPNGLHPDVEMVIAPVIPARPGFTARYVLTYKNKGNQTEDVFVNFNYNDDLMDYVSSSSTPFLSTTGHLSWSVLHLMPFQSGSIEVTMDINAPTDNPAVNIGDVLEFTSFIDASTDENWSDNAFQYNQTVVGSFDPNNIICLEGDVVPPAEIGNYLHYIINFENTGTADAQNIVVQDYINEELYDVSSLQILDSSRPVTAKLTGNLAEFIFQNINLHSGGHGNILLKIKSRSTLIAGDSVNKQADIFFDYNAPIATEMANTTFQLLNNPGYPTDASVSLYPNPTKDNITIKSENTIQNVQLYDIQGRLLLTRLVNEKEVILNISSRSNGVYFVKITTEKGMKVEKLLKQ